MLPQQRYCLLVCCSWLIFAVQCDISIFLPSISIPSNALLCHRTSFAKIIAPPRLPPYACVLIMRPSEKLFICVSAHSCSRIESYELRSQNLLASIWVIWGNASFTLFLYKAGCFSCSGLPSKYTVVNIFLSFSCFSTSRKSPIWL